MGVVGLPLEIQIRTTDLRICSRTACVRTPQAGNPHVHADRIGQVETVEPARRIEHIAEITCIPVNQGVATNHFSSGTQKTGDCLALWVLHAEMEFRIPLRGHKPGQAHALAAQPIASEETRQHNRLVRKGPGVGVLRVLASEFSKVLATFDLQAPGQAPGDKIGFFQFHHGVAVGFDLENDVGLSVKVGIHRSAQR